MRVLALDSTTARGSVAVVEDDLVRAEVRLHGVTSHSQFIMPAVEFLLSQVGLKLAALDGLAVTSGPGSFTGLRVGLGSVQGLALATGLRCVGLSALDVLAAQVGPCPGTLVTLMDAYRDEVYAGVYEAGRRVGDAQVASPEAVLGPLQGRVTVVGDGALRYRTLIASCRPDARIEEPDLFLAGRLGRLALPLLSNGAGVGPEALLPLYLREADIRRPTR